MPIKCLNSGCKRTFDDLEEYLRHKRDHLVDEGATFYAEAEAGGMYR